MNAYEYVYKSPCVFCLASYDPVFIKIFPIRDVDISSLWVLFFSFVTCTPNPRSGPLNLSLPVSPHDPDPHRTDGRVYQPSGESNPETTKLEAKVEGKEETERDTESIKCTARQI